jgi:hypothetical protein
MLEFIRYALRSTPADHFSITAVVAPTREELSAQKLTIFDEGLLKVHHNLITFDIEKEKVPLEIRCGCLEKGVKCLQTSGSEHWVVEWDTGSDLEMNKAGTAKRIGRPTKYEGVCKSDKKVRISPTETICCIGN